jgi:hypothetical protein
LPFIVTSTANCQAAIHVIVRLPDDEAAQPFLEPGGLCNDDRHRRDADNQGANERDNLQGSSSNRHQNA